MLSGRTTTAFVAIHHFSLTLRRQSEFDFLLPLLRLGLRSRRLRGSLFLNSWFLRHKAPLKLSSVVKPGRAALHVNGLFLRWISLGERVTDNRDRPLSNPSRRD